MDPDFWDSWEIEKKLGEGGYGSVFLIRNLQTGQQYALKIFNEEEIFFRTSLEDFERETAILEELSKFPYCSPGIVCYHQSLQIPWMTFQFQNLYHYAIITDYIPGETLNQWITTACRNRENNQNLDTIYRFLTEILSTLAYIHGLDIAHKDLSGNNIMITPGNDGELHPVLIDFGYSYKNSGSDWKYRDLRNLVDTFLFAITCSSNLPRIGPRPKPDLKAIKKFLKPIQKQTTLPKYRALLEVLIYLSDKSANPTASSALDFLIQNSQ